MHIEYLVPTDGDLPGLATITIQNPKSIPRVGEYVLVDGYRKVKRVEHYYGVIVSNGVKLVYASLRDINAHPNGEYETVTVLLSKRVKRA